MVNPEVNHYRVCWRSGPECTWQLSIFRFWTPKDAAKVLHNLVPSLGDANVVVLWIDKDGNDVTPW